MVTRVSVEGDMMYASKKEVEDMAASNERGNVDRAKSARRSSRFILRVPTPEAAGLSGAGSRVGGSSRPRSDSDLQLTLPALGSARAAR